MNDPQDARWRALMLQLIHSHNKGVGYRQLSRTEQEDLDREVRGLVAYYHAIAEGKEPKKE